MLHGDTAWVKPYLEVPWVTVLSKLAPLFPPAESAASSEAWYSFASRCSIPSAVVVLVGACAALAVLIRSCIRAGRRPTRRPSSKPVICTSILTLLLVAAGILAYLAVGGAGTMRVNHAVQEIGSVLDDVATARARGIELKQAGDGIAQAFQQILRECPAETQLNETLGQEVDRYQAQSARYMEYLDGLPGHLSDHAKNQLFLAAGMVFFSVLGPLALVVLCCVAIFAVVCATRGANGGGRCSNCCIHGFGAALVTPVVLVVTAVAAGELGAGVALGAFCRDADTNALTVIRQLGDETLYNISRSYIDGGVNPLTEALWQGSDSANATIAQLEKEVVRLECAPNATDLLARSAKSTRAPFDDLRRLLDPAHVYPLYEAAVHDFACTKVVSGLGWLSLSQLVVGVLCLPVLACMADRFFDRWVAWRARL